MGFGVAEQIGRLREALAARYTVDCEIGRGGMARVYRAHDRQHDRDVAIKVIRPELVAALGPDRFLREIHIAARLQHPHILPLHDSATAGGLLYFVMPYVQGETLRDRLQREKQLPWPTRSRSHARSPTRSAMPTTTTWRTGISSRPTSSCLVGTR